MARLLLGVGLAAWVGSLGACTDRVCEIDSADNLCDGDDDCVLAYCGTDCCYCPNAYSVRQIDATWCLTRQGESPISECQEGRDDRCAGHAPCVCNYRVEPWCNAGHCDIREAP